MIAYGRSKSANILFAVEFDRRRRVQGVRAIRLPSSTIAIPSGWSDRVPANGYLMRFVCFGSNSARQTFEPEHPLFPTAVIRVAIADVASRTAEKEPDAVETESVLDGGLSPIAVIPATPAA
jgi:hypothetical protein